ncbi:YaaC family protein [Trinickia symbiotica]|uniref:YaaC family protein n=1 Tax=Trinickia symbiotica TaxID=863227 RepID=UPI00036B2AD3|nr:YaaC family protein [Trinickia symbiotica]
MDMESWQQLLSLESRDIVSQWFEQLHGRQLNARRAKEINAAAKQAREYFKNASISDYSVRPLFTFYGVASLSRSLLLLLQRDNGEETLTKGHGLETIDWGSVISREDGADLKQATNLKIRTRAGLFYDFLRGTKNALPLHVRSSAVDGVIEYPVPDAGDTISFGDLLSRIPDLEKDFTQLSTDIKYSCVHEIAHDENSFGLRIKIWKKGFSNFSQIYDELGYTNAANGDLIELSAKPDIALKNQPQFIHTYAQKTFGSIPGLFIAAPFPSGARYSQICITYMVSFVIGMLARYYPTQWVSLIRGEKGDMWWPTINRAQQFVERSFPELIVEFVAQSLKQRAEAQQNPDQ